MSNNKLTTEQFKNLSNYAQGQIIIIIRNELDSQYIIGYNYSIKFIDTNTLEFKPNVNKNDSVGDESLETIERNIRVRFPKVQIVKTNKGKWIIGLNGEY